MNRFFLLLVLLWPVYGGLTSAQETVTISKSRLEELERKEAELEKLKGTTTRPEPPAQNPTPRKQDEADGKESPPQTSVNPPAPISPSAPNLASLPPLENGALVSAIDLAAHYRADAAAADRRYRKHTFKVHGEIVGFQKPMLIRDYSVILKTDDLQTRVICDFYPPENFKAVYTIDAGSALVALLRGETRAPIAKIGDSVVIEGKCKGLSGGGVKLTNCEMKGR